VAENVPSVIAISTDKACQPDNCYGQTKALMEKMFLEAHTQSTKFNVCRFGNVSHSHGSVIPYWLRLSAAGNSLPLTHKDMNRLIISRSGAARLVGEVIRRAESDDQAFVLTRKMKSVNMHDLARAISTDIEVVGLRPGEKLNETLIARSELPRTFCEDNYILIREFENLEENVLKNEYSSENSDFMNEVEINNLVSDTFDDMSQSLLASKIY
jgi:UDP-N-acetylglucosamine 4,6-dehydratase